MNKTLIALAALATISSAIAQTAPTGTAATSTATATPAPGTGFTVGATLDLGLRSITQDNMNNTGVEVVGGGYVTNRITLGGSTDIGSGTKIFGNYELGFQPTAADGLSSSWTRVAKVGVSGAFGTVSLGQDWSPYDNAMNDAMDYQHISAMAAAWNTASLTNINNPLSQITALHADNGNNTPSGTVTGMIQYQSPDVNGFNAVAAYAPSRKYDAANNGTDATYYGFGLNYAKGPVVVALATEHVPTNVSAPSIYVGPTLPAVSGGNTDSWVLTGSYDLTSVKLFGGLEGGNINMTTASNSFSATEEAYVVGVSVPLGKLTLSADIASKKTSINSQDTNSTNTAYGIQGL